MTINFDNFKGYDLSKAIYLIQTARNLGMDLRGAGKIEVNNKTGYTDLILDDYGFTLYMPIDCRLNENDVWVLFIDLDNGEEHEERLSNFSDLEEIEEWCIDKIEGLNN
jgi:hypothetical protein